MPLCFNNNLATGPAVSTPDVQNQLYAVDLYTRRPVVCVTLTARDCKDDKDWATEHVNMKRNKWQKIFFSLSPAFLFILIIDVFLSEGNVLLETILRSCRKMSDLAVGSDGIITDKRTDLHIFWNKAQTGR